MMPAGVWTRAWPKSEDRDADPWSDHTPLGVGTDLPGRPLQFGGCLAHRRCAEGAVIGETNPRRREGLLIAGSGRGECKEKVGGSHGF